jgi:hypothetical protein
MKVCPSSCASTATWKFTSPKSTCGLSENGGELLRETAKTHGRLKEEIEFPQRVARVSLACLLPNTATAQELFNACITHGGKGWDHSAVMRALEKLANFEIGQQA